MEKGMSEQSCTISSVIVHKLIKEQHKKEASVELGSAPLDLKPSTQRLIDNIHKLYSQRPTKGYGKFEDNENEFPIQTYIKEHIKKETTTFFDMSKSLMEHLKNRAERELLSTGGYVLIARLQNDGRDYLLVSIVTEVLGTAITEGLDVIDSTHLDISQMRVAGRIDLSGWEEGSERYISFLKGRSDIAEYFKLFLGCDDLVVALEESRKLKNALEEFFNSQDITKDKRDNVLQSAHDYLMELGKDNIEVSLDALANHIWPNDPDSLKQALADEELSLSDGFVPDRRAIRGLVNFEGKTKHWQLKFDRTAIRSGSIQYNRDKETITLKNLPSNLISELNSEIGDD